ncbi:hypothetical protein VF21_02228 [Pseudogymnoascus sp. 05NY08]|nr:hypothetical protein VF21_02228 [Pseudogymnoascus sp. 05NY08]
MFIGEMGCWLVVGLFSLYQRFAGERAEDQGPDYHAIHEDDEDASEADEESLRNPAVRVLMKDVEGRLPLTGWKVAMLALPATCDILGTTLMNAGFLFVVASVYQMTRGMLVIWVGIFSVVFLKKKLYLFQWCALATVVLGVTLVGLAGSLQAEDVTKPASVMEGAKNAAVIISRVASTPDAISTMIGYWRIQLLRPLSDEERKRNLKIHDRYMPHPLHLDPSSSHRRLGNKKKHSTPPPNTTPRALTAPALLVPSPPPRFNGRPMTMATASAPNAHPLKSDNDKDDSIYDPNDVGLRDSPAPFIQRPKLEPTPSPPQEGVSSEVSTPPGSPRAHAHTHTHKLGRKPLRPVPNPADAALINEMAGGRAREIAEMAGRELIRAPEEEEDEDMRGVEVPLEGMAQQSVDLEALAAGALRAFNAEVPVAKQSHVEEVGGQMDDQQRHVSSPKISTINGNHDELPPIQEASPKAEKLTNTPLSQQLSIRLRPTDTGTRYPRNPRRNHRSSDGGPDFPGTAGVGETASTDHAGAAANGIPAGIDRMSIDGITNPLVGGFQCHYPNCTAQPFQTQYLLNSHANVHSQNRPHYCPVKGCQRSEGGKGFKRKNEMIRHGLVHESPGYVCPYCMDREHKYPRPDNLQRHVRVHHVDKDKDDPLLREVLAQRPEGPSRGRRRRGGNN